VAGLPGGGSGRPGSGTPSPRPSPTATPRPRTAYGQFFLDRLAAALGIDRARLDNALTQARNQTIDQMVREGRLTQEQAERAKQRAVQPGAGLFGLPMPRPHLRGWPPANWMRPAFPGPFGDTQALAQKLGMTVEELRSRLRSGATLSQLAQEKGVSLEELREAALAPYRARLEQAVQNGRLTREQADRLLEQVRRAWERRLAPRPTPTPTPAPRA